MRVVREDELYHFGIKGMRKGQRRWTNPDGTLNEAGKRRYGIGDGQQSGQTLFVSGSSKTQDKASGYYRKKLPKQVRSELDSSMKNRDKIIVGDAPGVDRQVQKYLKKKHYKDVEVYGPGKEVRYSANKKWKTNAIDDPEHEPMSKEWLAKKDKAMTDASTKGLAVILDEGAQATRNNVRRLVDQNKNVKVFQLHKKEQWDHFADGQAIVDQMVYDEVRSQDHTKNISPELSKKIDNAVAENKTGSWNALWSQPEYDYHSAEFDDDKYGSVKVEMAREGGKEYDPKDFSHRIKNELGMISGKPKVDDVVDGLVENMGFMWFHDKSRKEVTDIIGRSKPILHFYVDGKGCARKEYYYHSRELQESTGGHNVAVALEYNPKTKKYEPSTKAAYVF